MFFVAADRIANGIYDEAYVGMGAATLAASGRSIRRLPGRLSITY